MPAIINSESSIKRCAQPWTDDWVAALTHPERGRCERVFNDPTISGHRLIVKRNKKVFEVRQTIVVRVADAMLERARKERSEIISVVEEARKRAVALLSDFRSAIARSESKPLGAVTGVTLGAAWARYKERKDLSPTTTLKMYESQYRRHLEKWKDVPLLALNMSPAMAHDEHKEITHRSGPAEADHTLKLLQAIYNHASRFDTSLPRDRHPCGAVEWNRDRNRVGAVIPSTMMPHWKRQLEIMRSRRPVHAGFHMLCLRLGTRPGDLARSRWRDVDWKRKVMFLPDTKGFCYEVPLTHQSLYELRKLRATPLPNKELTVDFIFPSPRIHARNEGHLVN